jgi:probable regulatory domain-containing protein
MSVLSPEAIPTTDIDAMALRVFLKAIELLGGPRKLVEYRHLTWLPSLMEAAYVVVLTHEAAKTEEEIAAFLGLTRTTVRNIRRADADQVKAKLSGALEQVRTLRSHIAGALAQWAYREVRAAM